MANAVDTVLLDKSSLGNTLGGQGVVIGRHYTLHARIGVGGMASVYLGWLASAADFSRVVAVKRMHPQFALDEQFVARFQDEARLTARLSHPNVVQVFDVVEQNRELLIVMEYVHGISLGCLAKDAADAGCRLPASVIAGVLVPSLDGLHAVHEATDDEGHPIGIVHRDFSPQNIMVTSDGHSKILDLGIAKARTHSHITLPGGFSGKVGYCSPEQISSGIVDRRTDVFAAGIVLWEMLTSQRLFYSPGMSDAEAMSRVLSQPIQPPSAANPEVPAKLDKVVLHALQRAPDRRFATAREFASELEKAVDIATPSMVADCLSRVSAGRMAKRTRMLSGTRRRMARARLDGGSASATPADEIVVREQLPEPVRSSVVTVKERGSATVSKPRRRSLVLGGAIGAVVLVSAVVFGRNLLVPSIVPPEASKQTEGSRPPYHAPEIVPVPAPPSALPVATASGGSQELPDTLVQRPAIHPAARAAVRRSPLARPHARPAAASSKPASQPNCDPPTYLDADGIRVFKDECL